MPLASFPVTCDEALPLSLITRGYSFSSLSLPLSFPGKKKRLITGLMRSQGLDRIVKTQTLQRFPSINIIPEILL